VLILLLFGEQPEPFDIRGYLIFLIPAIIGVLLGIKVFFEMKVAKYNRSRLIDHELEKSDWEQRKAKIQQLWEKENNLIRQKWEHENDQIFTKWQEDNSLTLKEWEISNVPILEEWKKKNSLILNKWLNVAKRWEDLYFCYRDDIVFIPGEDTYALVENMKD